MSEQSGSGVDQSRVDQMNKYKEIRKATRNLRDNALQADDVADNVTWIAAGGLGTGNLGELEKLAVALRQTAQDLENLAREAPDPREVRDSNHGDFDAQ